MTYEVTQREAAKILPRLIGKMFGNGGFHLDTDTLRLSDPTDRHHLEWLSRIVAGFVLEEQEIWKPQVEECMGSIEKQQRELTALDALLEQLRDAAAKDGVTAEELKELIGKYRNPMERYYDDMRAEREKRRLLDELVEQDSRGN